MAAVLLYVCSAFVVWICGFMPPVEASGMRCPSSCTCLGNNVDCSSFGFVNIPKDIPGWVTRLELQSNRIVDVQPSDFHGLNNLQYLDLSNNEIKSIPGSVFQDLLALQTLKLDSNKLTEIPLFLSPLNITELSLSHNHVVIIPMQAMQQMPELVSMDLSSNFILSLTNGSFPVGSKLTHLTLNSNQISVIEQGSMSNVTFLETLRVNKNKVNELPQGVFSQLNSLKCLELMRNKIRTIKGLTFQGLNKLQVLKLKRNNIAVLKDGAFWGLPSLISLQIDHNKIVNVTQAWLFGLEALRTLTLSHNKITTIAPEAWVHGKHLEKIDLTNNKLTTLTEITLAHLISLDVLMLDHNQISRIDEGTFKDMEDLSTLEMNSNHIPWTMEDLSGAFRGLTGLTKLGLRANAIRSIDAHAFAAMPSLRILHLEDNDITLIQENAFQSLRGLEDLRFNSSKFFCDCHLAWMPSWLRQSGFQHSALGTCHHPPVLRGAAIFQVDVADFKCNNAEFPKPVILESPKSANGFKGENMTLTCVTAITGDSQPRIHWKKDNMIMDGSLSELVASSDGDVKRYSSNLHLLDIQDSMAGRYQCIVSNDFGSAFSQRAYISVYVYPVFLKVPKDVTVKAGKPAELKCSATGQPAPVISWQKDGGDNFPAARERRMQVYPKDDRFYIMNTRPADEGVYSCMARNEAGVAVTNATVTVLETPDFVQPMQGKKFSKKGETTVLQCMASGSPQPKLTWLKEDNELVMTPRHFFTVDNQILVIVDTQWSDAGTYACRMSNSLGTAKGTTELQVLSSSGEAGKTGSSFGLDDESTTTGIIIIAVVCCVVGTSLVWVIIIYHTRKRHEVYSATPTDDTTLAGEAPSSGYVSSEKEGSYLQGPMAANGYHYQDYQMKESGYESSSGQYRANRYACPPVCTSDVEEDNKPPALTAGDLLLRQIRGANSASSLPYPASDWDTIGSRHSTSSGHHSGSSDPSSSHSGQLDISLTHHQLLVVALGEDEFGRTSSRSLDSSALEESNKNHPTPNTNQQMIGRPLFQTIRSTKPTNHDRSCNVSVDGSHSPTDLTSDRVCEEQSEPWHRNYSCDNNDNESTTTNNSHIRCNSCLLECSVVADHSRHCECLYSHCNIHRPLCNHSLCMHKILDRDGKEKVPCDGAGFNTRHLDRDKKPPHLPSSLSYSSSSSSSSSNPCLYTKQTPPSHSDGCKNMNQTMDAHGGDSQESFSPVYHCGSIPCDCREEVASSSQPRAHTPRLLSQPSSSAPSDTMRDSHQCLPHSSGQEMIGAGLSCSTCTCRLNDSSGHRPQQQYLICQDTSDAVAWPGLPESPGRDPAYCLHNDCSLSSLQKVSETNQSIERAPSSFDVTNSHRSPKCPNADMLSLPGKPSSGDEGLPPSTIPISTLGHHSSSSTALNSQDHQVNF